MKRTSSTRYLVLVVAIEQTETHDAPSSSFPAAPANTDKPGLARTTQPTSGEMFPFARKAGGGK